jgi:hypothetical protein
MIGALHLPTFYGSPMAACRTQVLGGMIDPSIIPAGVLNMDWAYLLGPSALHIAVGFVIAKLFDALGERRQDRRLRVQLAAEQARLDAQLAAERDRLQLQERAEIRKQLFDSRIEAALRISRLLKGTVYMLRTQILAYAAAYSEDKLDVDRFRTIRDRAFEQLKSVAAEGEDAAAVLELLFAGVSFGELPHQTPFMVFMVAWQSFLDKQGQFLQWLQAEATALPPMLSTDVLKEKEHAVTQRMQEMLTDVRKLATLLDDYDASVSKTIRMLSEALQAQ